ncbi:MAG: acyl-CoA dehydrogenase family protein [Bacteroidales bacterium]|nr:acyl-CoA dehydrogenase family protein [Bacteroidales bacterium]
MANYYRDNEALKYYLSHPLLKKIVKLKEKNFENKDKCDYAPIDFEDALDSYDKILEILGEIAADIVAPNAEYVDDKGPELINNRVKYAEGTKKNIDALMSAGMMGFSLPRIYNGLNMPLTIYIMAAEIISRADAGFANIFGLQDCAETIHEFAGEELHKEYLPLFSKGYTAAMVLTEPDAGSDLQAVQLKATWDENKKVWLLNGVKRFITNGGGNILLVLARSEEGTKDGRGLSLFLLHRDETIKIRRIEHKLGIIGSPTCEIVFTNTPSQLIGERKLGLIKYVMSLMNAARLGIGAQSVGIAEAAYREALKYANEREQFGKKIIDFPQVYEMLTNIKVRLDAIRCLLYETTRFVDMYKAYIYIEKERKLEADEKGEMRYYQKLADVYTPMLKAISSEYCNQIAYDSLQIHGGTGFMRDFPISRIYRDARITSIYEGTTQLQVIAAIKGVTNGAFLNKIKEYENIELNPEYDFLKLKLVELTDIYINSVNKVVAAKDNEYLDFHSRRLVEIAANIIMSYLLLFDANEDIKFRNSAELFINISEAEIIQKSSYINNFDSKSIGLYKSNTPKQPAI